MTSARTPAAAAARARAVAVLMVVLSAVVWPMVDAIARVLSDRGVPATQIAWGRYTLNAALLLVPVLRRHGRAALLPRLAGPNLLRVLLPAVVTVLFFVGIAHLPFASASALLFVNPLLITAASGPVLGERVGAARWAAVGVGFAGALLVMRPGTDVFSWASLAPLGAAAAFAAVAVLNRRLAGDAPALATTFHYGLVSSVVLLPFAAGGGWKPLEPAVLGPLAVMAVFGGLAMWLVTSAYERAEASALAPFHYGELVFATGIGVVAFREIPDAVTLAGIALIVGAGLWVATRPSPSGQAAAG